MDVPRPQRPTRNVYSLQAMAMVKRFQDVPVGDIITECRGGNDPTITSVCDTVDFWKLLIETKFDKLCVLQRPDLQSAQEWSEYAANIDNGNELKFGLAEDGPFLTREKWMVEDDEPLVKTYFPPFAPGYRFWSCHISVGQDEDDPVDMEFIPANEFFPAPELAWEWAAAELGALASRLERYKRKKKQDFLLRLNVVDPPTRRNERITLRVDGSLRDNLLAYVKRQFEEEYVSIRGMCITPEEYERDPYSIGDMTIELMYLAFTTEDHSAYVSRMG